MTEGELRALIDASVDGVVARHFKDETPSGGLFHYTDEHAMLQIFERGRMWAGHTGYMNDFGETRHAIDMLDSHFEKRFESAVPFSMVNEWIRDIEIANKEGAYLISLSEESDLLSQWRAYAGDGRGYSIQVSFDQIDTTNDILGDEGHRKSAGLVGPVLFRCVYDDAEKDTVLADLVQTIEALLRASSPLPPERHYELVWRGIMRAVTFCALAFKSSAFKEEKEWRLVWIGDTAGFARGTHSDILRFRSTRYGLSPYLDWPLRKSELWKVLPSVTCGPRVDIKKMKKTFPRFLAWLGAPPDSVEIRSSAATYR